MTSRLSVARSGARRRASPSCAAAPSRSPRRATIDHGRRGEAGRAWHEQRRRGSARRRASRGSSELPPGPGALAPERLGLVGRDGARPARGAPRLHRPRGRTGRRRRLVSSRPTGPSMPSRRRRRPAIATAATGRPRRPSRVDRQGLLGQVRRPDGVGPARAAAAMVRSVEQGRRRLGGVSLSTGQTGPRGMPANTASTLPPAAVTAFAAYAGPRWVARAATPPRPPPREPQADRRRHRRG